MDFHKFYFDNGNYESFASLLSRSRARRHHVSNHCTLIVSTFCRFPFSFSSRPAAACSALSFEKIQPPPFVPTKEHSLNRFLTDHTWEEVDFTRPFPSRRWNLRSNASFRPLGLLELMSTQLLIAPSSDLLVSSCGTRHWTSKSSCHWQSLALKQEWTNRSSLQHHQVCTHTVQSLIRTSVFREFVKQTRYNFLSL